VEKPKYFFSGMKRFRGGIPCIFNFVPEIIFFFKETNSTYTSVNYRPDSWHAVEVTSQDHFAAGGVHLIVLEPMRKWRIIFNGMVKYEITKQRERFFLYIIITLYLKERK